MNRKGQVLVMFVILLPFILMLGAFIFDKLYILHYEKELKNTAGIACRYALTEEREEEIKKLVYKNDIDISEISIDREKGITIGLVKDIDGVFGKIIGFDSYKIKTKISCIE